MLINALVYGWYGEGVKNIGDSLFCKAFAHLFPNINFKFVKLIERDDIERADMIIFGGGSFLYAPINVKNIENPVELLATKKIFYIGVGIETDIHPMHQTLMKVARLIATRTIGGTSKLKPITDTKILEIPDLAYALEAQVNLSPTVIAKSILVMTNAELLPRWYDIHWKHASWNYFKSEFSQFLDSLRESKYLVTFASMCSNAKLHDLGAAAEISNQMKHRDFNTQLYDLPDDFGQLTNIISQYEIVISQRFHGAILAKMCKRPCIVIAHHDKLKNSTDSCVTVPYYGTSKQNLSDAVLNCKTMDILPIKLDIFEDVRCTVYSHLGAECPNILVSKMEKSK
jgi:polysaccharide pyruvyl transferase WcaK-like protein